MTPKEKAEELVEKFYKYAHGLTENVFKQNAKQCALIAVDEVIDALDQSLVDADIEYWKQVKEEINQL